MPEIYPDGYYAFNADAIGTMGDDGKVYYRSAINVHIGKYEAMRILRQIANSNLLDVGGDPYRTTLSFSGTIERIEDDPINPECLAERHDFKLEADRLRGTNLRPGQIYGTGGWDLLFRCTRQPCHASKYTTYGMTPVYLSDATGEKVYEWDRSPCEFDH